MGVVLHKLSRTQHKELSTQYGEHSMKPEPTRSIELTLMETGVLCNVLMLAFHNAGGVEKQPAWLLELYEKLAHANDILMGKAS